MTPLLRLLACLALLLLAARTNAAQAPDPDLARGIQQVAEGDFEGAVPTLQAAARTLEGNDSRAYERARALMYLGVAQVGLDDTAAARASFKDALRAWPRLQPTTAEFSPKVLQTFDAARREWAAEQPAPAARRSRAPWIVAGAGAAAAGIAVAAGSDGGETAGGVEFMNARFGTPVIVCPNGSHELPIPFTILVDADASAAAEITSLTATTIIVASAFEPEIGFASSQAAAAVPTRVPSGRSTVRIETSLLCGNGAGDPPRFNEWSGRVTLTTRGGTATLSTADRMRVNIP